MIKTDEDSKMKVILASKSPRRKEIFGAYAKECGFSFDIITRETDEELFGEHPVTGVKTLAERKGVFPHYFPLIVPCRALSASFL